MLGIENLALFIAGQEWIFVIVAIAVIFFGAKKIPELARSMGKATSEYEKARIDAEKEITQFKGERMEREKLNEIAKALGVDNTNKNDEELRLAVEKAIKKEK
ncbi:MAG: twin-arginine translocase TatA/TatE family subunit [Thaumarchaeota archaeon]|nr:twin-arginine translocase TatA/TatE family subunit [Nitrososphaerota archaeon]